MNLFKKVLADEESLFLDAMSLDYDYLPKLLPHREEKQFYLASCIKPLLQKRTGKNVFITGQPGIGKTAAVRFVLRDLENDTDDIIPFYINCWKKNTPHKVVLELCEKVGYSFVVNKTTEELIKKVAEICNKKHGVVFVFDEVDKLEDLQILYILLEEIDRKCLFLITNEEGWLQSVDQRILSRLMPEVVEFEPYTYGETKDILKERVKYAFVKNVWNDEAIEVVVQKSAEYEDMRLGLFLLRESGTVAESKASREIQKEHVEKALEKIHLYKTVDAEDLDKEKVAILDLIQKNSGKTAIQLYEIFKKEYGKSYRTFFRRLKSLGLLGMISLKGERNEQGGQSTIVEMGKDLSKK